MTKCLELLAEFLLVQLLDVFEFHVEIPRDRFGHLDAIDARGEDAAGVTRAFAARIQAARR